jgi:hypothetical protein
MTMCDEKICNKVKRLLAGILGEILLVKDTYGPSGVIADHLEQIEEHAMNSMEILEECSKRKEVSKDD